MPSIFRKLGHNVKSLFQSRSRDGHRNADLPGAVNGTAAPSSSPPSAAAGLLPPIVAVTPTLSAVDLTKNKDPIEPQDTGQHGPSNSPSINSSGRQSPPEGPLFWETTSSILPHSYNPPATGIALSESHRQPVPESAAPTATGSDSPSMPLRHDDTLSIPPVPIRVVPSTSYFSNARDFRVSNLNVQNSFAHSKSLFEYLSPHITHGAAHDSGERWNAPACHEQTRVAIREDIVSWIKHGERDEEPKRIMWLSGPAGCGKTAIAGSVAETCKEEELLSASFFFSSISGSAERSSKRGLIATLAFHMSKIDALHRFKDHLHASIERHPDIFHKNLKEQAKYLILEPFWKAHDGRENRVGWPKVVIIDGLDEVVAAQHHISTEHQSPRASEDDQVEILHVLLNLSKDPFFPFQIFIASRPERNIANFFSTISRDTTVNLFLDSKYKPDNDILCFLMSKFIDIKRRTGISIPFPPGLDDLDRLVEMSSGQFTVAVTIVRWVESGLPQQRLDDVLKLVDVRNKNPFATLDALYDHILKRALIPDSDLHLVVKWVLSLNSGVSGYNNRNAMFWRGLLEDEEGELNYRLAPIISLISVPPPDDTSSPITIHHKSLIDFLSSPSRCGDLYIEDTAQVSFISERIFLVLKNKGPIVPLPSPPDLVKFLRFFFHLRLLMKEYPGILTSLSQSSKAELASIDVAWWTGASLSNLRYNGSSLSQNGHSIEDYDGWGVHPWLVRLIYHRIHQAMACSCEIFSLAQGAPQNSPSSKCLAACRHWRAGILAKAKELGWCVHELEGVELDELEKLDCSDVKRKLKHPVNHSCRICRPV